MLARRSILSPIAVLCLALGTVFFAVSCGKESAPPKEEVPRSVVLVTIDTLRSDHLGSYGYPRDTSPFLDRLAAEGRRFESVISPCSHTAPAHASILTSLQPFQHGVLKNGQGLREEFDTLAEQFSVRGDNTAGFVSVGFLSELQQGFETFHAQWQTGDLTVDRALDWFRSRQDPTRPFFLWVHLYDPHSLKGPREKLQDDVAFLRAKDVDESARFIDYLSSNRGLDPSVYPSTERLLERYDTYDAGIRFADRQVERLHREIASQGSDTLFVVTSDHGEGLGNHDYGDHGRYLYREQLQVPLILWGPGITPGVTDRLVRLVDIYPTVLEWAGLPTTVGGREIEGYSLLDSPTPTRSLSPRLAYAQRRPKDGAGHRENWEDGEIRSLQTDRFKYISHSEAADEFFDLEADPWEMDNRIDEGSSAEEDLRRLLEAYVTGSVGAETGEDGSEDGSEDEATKHDDELRALGYL
ncbi:MAG: sulfatase [Thermoanaerobaculia bacterium]|nr:sulfatase [Thermoanaerobaculia bacterium]